MDCLRRVPGLRKEHRPIRRLHNTRSLKRRDPCYLTAKLFTQLSRVDHIAVLLYDIHHIHRHDHRDPKLHKLRGQIKITLNVRAVYDINDGIRPVTD